MIKVKGGKVDFVDIYKYKGGDGIRMPAITLFENSRCLVVADYIEQNNVVIILELVRGGTTGHILDGITCKSKDEAFAFAKQWAKENWAGLSEDEKQVLRILAPTKSEEEAFVHRSKIEDFIKDNTEKVLSSLYEKGFITSKIDIKLTESGKEAISKLGP